MLSEQTHQVRSLQPLNHGQLMQTLAPEYWSVERGRKNSQRQLSKRRNKLKITEMPSTGTCHPTPNTHMSTQI
jgi:hypothetical protein